MGFLAMGIDDEGRAKKYTDTALLKRMMRYLGNKRRLVIASTLVTIGAMITALMMPIILQLAVDDYMATGKMDSTWQVALLYFIVLVLNFLMEYLNRVLLGMLALKIMYEIREDVVIKLQYISIDYFEKNETGKIMSRGTNDVQSMGELISSGVIDLIGQFLTIGGIVAILIWYDWLLAIATLSLVPILVFVILLFRNMIRRAYRKTRKTIANVYANIEENVSGIKDAKAMAREEHNIKEFDRINKENFEAQVNASKISAMFFPIVGAFSAMATVVVLWVGGIQVNVGSLTIGELLAFLQYTTMFFRPILSLVFYYNIFQSGLAAAERIFELIDMPEGVIDLPDAIELKKVEGRIEFDNVSFSYIKGIQVLKGISFTVEPNEMVALVGHTGAGKTTITNLIARFYDVNEGSIKLDGIDIRKIKISSLRKHVGIVQQDVFLFSGTIRDNIKYGNPDASDEEMIKVCKMIGIHDFVQSLPNGYDTEVLERGKILSTGQKQLVSIARVLLANPKVLIFDEATSSMDVITEAKIQRALKILFKNRTSIVIAHRLSTIRNADKIIVLEKGQIKEIGKHEDLLKRKGIYHDLYKTQLLETTHAIRQ